MNGSNKKVIAGAVALGVALGSYGIANAASGSTTTTTPSATAERSAHRARSTAGLGRSTQRRDAPHR